MIMIMHNDNDNNTSFIKRQVIKKKKKKDHKRWTIKILNYKKMIHKTILYYIKSNHIRYTW